MTQANLLELAKQGDPQAIATLMNQSLQSKGLTARVERQGDELEVILEAERVPNRQALTAFVQQGIHNLGIQTIRSIRILGQQTGAGYPAWMQELIIDPSMPGTPFIIQPEIQPETELASEMVAPSDLDIQSGEGSVDAVAAAPGSIEELLMDPELPTEPSLSLEEQLMQLELAELPADESSEELAALWNQQSQSQPDDFLQELLAEPSAMPDPESAVLLEDLELSAESAEIDAQIDQVRSFELFDAPQSSSSLDPEAALTELQSTPTPETTSDAELLDFLNELSDGTSTDTAFPDEPSQTESAFANDWFSEETGSSMEPPFQELFIESSEGTIETPSLEPGADSLGDFATGFSADDPTDVAAELPPENSSGQPDAEFIDFFDDAATDPTTTPLEPPDFLLDLESETAAPESLDFALESSAADEPLQDWFADTSDTATIPNATDPLNGFDALPTTETMPVLEDNELPMVGIEPSTDLTESDDEGWLDFLDTPSDASSLDAPSADWLPNTAEFSTASSSAAPEEELDSWFGETPTMEGLETGAALTSDRPDFGSDLVEPPADTEWLTAPFVTTGPPEEAPQELGEPTDTSTLSFEESFGTDLGDDNWQQSDFQVVQLPDSSSEAMTLEGSSFRAAETEAEAQLYDQIDSLFAAEPETSEFESFTEEPLDDQRIEVPEELAQNWLGEPVPSTDLPDLSFLDQPPTQSESTAWMNAQTFEAPDSALDSSLDPSREDAVVDEQTPPAELLQDFSWDDSSEASMLLNSEEPAWSESESEFVAASDEEFLQDFPTEPPAEFAAAYIEPVEPPATANVTVSYTASYYDAADEVIEMPPDFLLEMEASMDALPGSSTFEEFPEPASVTATEELPPEPTSERIAEISADDFGWDMFDPDPSTPQVSQDFSDPNFAFDDFSFDEPAPAPETPETMVTMDVTATDPLDELFADEPIDVAVDEPADEPASGNEAAFSEPVDPSDADLPDLFVQEPERDPFLDTLDAAPQPEDFLTEPTAESWDDPLFASDLPAATESDGASVGATENLTAAMPAPAFVADGADEATADVSQDVLEAGLGDFREGFVEQPLPPELTAHETAGAIDWEQELAGSLDQEPDGETLTYVIEEPATAVEYPVEPSTDDWSQPSLAPVTAEPTPPELAQMSGDMAPAMTATESRSPSWLFGLVLLLLVGWLAGLLGFSLFWSRVAPPAPEAPAPGSPAAPPGSPSP